MFDSRSKVHGVASLFCAAVLLGADDAFGRTIPFDLRPPPATRRAMSAPPSTRDGAARSVQLDAGFATPGELTAGDKLVFTLFDDVTVALTLKQKMPSPLGGDVFLAEASGYEGMRTAVVLCTADGLTIDAQDFRNGKVYKVISTRTGVKVAEFKPESSETHACDTLEPHPANAPSSFRNSLTAAVQCDGYVDILVAYEKKAVEFADANGGITNFAQIAVQKMNTALANTELGEKFWFRLVGVCALQSEETDLNRVIARIDGDEEGWKEVKAVREAVGADIVSVLVDTGSLYGTIGTSWLLTPNFSAASFGGRYGFGACSIRHVMEMHTMTHECGHAFGAGHSDVQGMQPGPQFYNYSSGYFFEAGGQAYGTVMAYAHQNPSGKPTMRIPYFSSPHFSYDGVAIGDAKHDNTRTIANTFTHVSNWQPRKVPASGGVTFSPPGDTFFDGSIDVTLSPDPPGTEIRYTLDGSAPTDESPVYTGPIRVTETTKVKACTVLDGVCSLPFTAAYYLKGTVGFALRMTGAEWQYYGNLPSPYKGGTYNGYAKDGNGKIEGTFVLKVQKQNKEVSGATLTFASLATGKKTKRTGSIHLPRGEGRGALAGLSFGANAVGGQVEGVGELDGCADAAKAKDAAALAVLNTFNGRKYIAALAPEDKGVSQGGYSTLRISFLKKGKARIDGVLADGTRINTSGQMTVGDLYCCVPVVSARKNKFGGVAWFDKDTRALAGLSALTSWRRAVKPAFTIPWAVSALGAAGSIPGGRRTVTLDEGKLRALVPGAIGQTPQTVELTVKGNRWITEKAAKVTYKGGALRIAGANVAGLKLRYSAKTGAFRGAFTVYAVKGGRLAKNRFAVSGFVTGGTGYGTAVLRGKGSVPLVIR